MILTRVDWYINNEVSDPSKLQKKILSLTKEPTAFTKVYAGNSNYLYYPKLFKDNFHNDSYELSTYTKILNVKELSDKSLITIDDLDSIIIDDGKYEVTYNPNYKPEEKIKETKNMTIPINPEFALEAYKAAIDNNDLDVAKKIKENVDMFNKTTSLNFVKEMKERYKSCSEWAKKLEAEFRSYITPDWKEVTKDFKYQLANGIESIVVTTAGYNHHHALETYKEAEVIARKVELMIDMHNFAKIKNEGWENKWRGAALESASWGLVIRAAKVTVTDYIMYDVFVNNITVKNRKIAEEMLKEFGERIETLYIKTV